MAYKSQNVTFENKRDLSKLNRYASMKTLKYFDEYWSRPHNILKYKRLESLERIPRNARMLTTESECSNWINDPLDADHGNLHLHHKTIQANWHQYLDVRVCELEC